MAPHTCFGNPRRRGTENGAGQIFEEIMSKNIPKWMKYTIPEIQAAQLSLNRINIGRGKSGFTVGSMQNTKFILVLLFINYCIFHTNNCKPTFAPACIKEITPRHIIKVLKTKDKEQVLIKAAMHKKKTHYIYMWESWCEQWLPSYEKMMEASK